ncbi:hypothetical protein ACFQZ0_03610 [Streptomyces erythrogriseus]
MNRSVPALAVACLAALTACGGGGGTENSTGEPGPSATRSEQAAPAERLAGLMVTPAEVKGFAVKPYDNEFALATASSEMTADKPACAPLALALNQLPLGEPQADLTRVLAPESQGLNSTQTYVTLTSYATGGAKAVLADVKKAVDACGDGFTAEGATAAPSTTRSRRRTSPRPARRPSVSRPRRRTRACRTPSTPRPSARATSSPSSSPPTAWPWSTAGRATRSCRRRW